MKVKHSPSAIEYCKEKGIPMSKFQEKFDSDLASMTLQKEKMFRIYLASPYTHDDPAVMEERYLAVCLKASQLAKEGYYVYSPIAHWHPIAKLYGLPRDWEFWKKMDRESIQLMDVVQVLKLEGWSISIGLGNEILIAKEFNKPYSFIDP